MSRFDALLDAQTRWPVTVAATSHRFPDLPCLSSACAIGAWGRIARQCASIGYRCHSNSSER
jgi:hypothetical protein